MGGTDAPGFARHGIEAHDSIAEYRGCLPTPTPDHGAKPRQQFLHVEGFPEGIIGTATEYLAGILDRVSRADDDDRHPIVLPAQSAQDLRAAAFGKSEVEQD